MFLTRLFNRSSLLRFPMNTMLSADFCSALENLSVFFVPSLDTLQTSRGKYNRLQHTAAKSTLCTFDGYGIYCWTPALPILTPLFGSCSSAHAFDTHCLRTLPHDNALVFR